MIQFSTFHVSQNIPCTRQCPSFYQHEQNTLLVKIYVWSYLTFLENSMFVKKYPPVKFLFPCWEGSVTLLNFSLLCTWLPQVSQDSEREHTQIINTLAPERFKVNFRWVIFKLILVANGWSISCETVLIWVSLDHTYLSSQHWFR